MWLMLIVFILTLVYYLLHQKYSFWSKSGVPGPKPVPVLGNFAANVFGKKSAGEIIKEIYKKYDGYPFVGIYRTTTPVLLVRDPDFIKNIVIRDFKNFHDNDVYADKDLEPLFGRHPFVLKGLEWKQKRATLTSCFTSGKIKGMYVFLDKNANRMIRYIKDETKDSLALELREVCIRFTLDNVAACAFGLEGKCFDETRSDFRELADGFLSTDSINKFKLLIFVICPWIAPYLKMKFVPEKIEKRLCDIVRSTLQYRKDNNVIRNDFLDAMSQISVSDGLFTEMDIIANAAGFFGDGYETSSRVMAFALFELALNPEVQDTLRDEINNALTETNNKFTYEIIQELSYLDACLNESLRKNSIVSGLNKLCTEDYTYTPTNPDLKSIRVHIKAGTSILLPLDALQNDPKYFEEPDKFKPERFLNKEENNFNKYTFIPFGEGPRVCLGQRFGVTQIKVGIAYIIKNYRITANPKTKLPIKFDPYYIMLHPVDGLWVNFHAL